MRKIWNCFTVTIVGLTMLALLAPAIKADSTPLVCVVGNDVLLDALELDLNLYSEDLAREGLRTKIVASNEGNCTDLKALITNEFSTGLVGCLFIGDLPVAYFEDRQVHNETYPCDLYFEDLDGTWIDADHNGMFENHTDGANGNRSPEIWVGRLKVPVPYGLVLDEVSLLKKYFDRNHAYRTGNLSLPNRALLYIDDPWSDQNDTLDSAISAAFSNRTVVYDKAITNPQDYLNRLTQGWKLVELVAHGGGESHAFYVNDTYFGSVTRKDIRAIDPHAFFYTLGSCLCSDFDFFNDYIAGSYVFCSNYSLALLGITDSGLLWNLTDFYSGFSTERLGRSVIRAFENWITEEDAGSWYNFAFFYGVTVIGDPTLRLNSTRASDVLLGDINNDRIVDIEDLSMIAFIFGLTNEDERFDPRCDLNNDQLIDIIDLVAAAHNFGRSIPINPP